MTVGKQKLDGPSWETQGQGTETYLQLKQSPGIVADASEVSVTMYSGSSDGS